MREHERDRRAHAEEPAQPAPAVQPRALDVVALQRSAGNQAVSRWLAREEEGGTGTRDRETDWKVKVSKVGSIDASSVSWSMTGPGGIRDLSVVNEPGAHTVKLQTAMVSGTPVNVDVAHKTGFKHSVKNGVISSYSFSGGGGQAAMESWTVSPPTPKKRLSEDGTEPEPEPEPG